MWTDYYLKFADEAEFASMMPEGLKLPASQAHATDVVGILRRDPTLSVTGVDENGRAVVEMVAGEEIAGFHVNLRLAADLPGLLLPYVIEAPTRPKQVWA